MNRLSNKIALVTGAAQGIGEAIVRAFIDEGAFVFITDIKQEQGIALAKELGSSTQFETLDVRIENDWDDAISKVIEDKGKLDILVNNAGITGFEEEMIIHDPEHAKLEDWEAVHRTNLNGTFLGCKYGIQAMRKTGSGSIINISSRSGLVGIPRAAAYASSKAAIRNHTKSVALYCAEEGLNIRCNSIHPAAIMTPIWEPMIGSGPDREKRIKELVKNTPMKRFGKPEEVAALAILLASDESAYLTGSEITIDGGLLAGSVASPKVED